MRCSQCASTIETPIENTVRNFPTHGQLSAACTSQGSLYQLSQLDFALLNSFDSSAL
jgi:hypothetical protein